MTVHVHGDLDTGMPELFLDAGKLLSAPSRNQDDFRLALQIRGQIIPFSAPGAAALAPIRWEAGTPPSDFQPTLSNNREVLSNVRRMAVRQGPATR
jgi:hypothetical protein